MEVRHASLTTARPPLTLADFGGWRPAWHHLRFAAPAVFVMLAGVEAFWLPGGVLRALVYVVYGPGSMALAAASYLDQGARSVTATALLLAAGVGSIVIQGIADDPSITSLQLFHLIALLAAAQLAALAFALRARRLATQPVRSAPHL